MGLFILSRKNIKSHKNPIIYMELMRNSQIFI